MSVPVNNNYPTVTVSVNKNCPTGSVINKLAIFSSMGVSVWRLQIGLILLKEGVTRAFHGCGFLVAPIRSYVTQRSCKKSTSRSTSRLFS